MGLAVLAGQVIDAASRVVRDASVFDRDIEHGCEHTVSADHDRRALRARRPARACGCGRAGSPWRCRPRAETPTCAHRCGRSPRRASCPTAASRRRATHRRSLGSSTASAVIAWPPAIPAPVRRSSCVPARARCTPPSLWTPRRWRGRGLHRASCGSLVCRSADDRACDSGRGSACRRGLVGLNRPHRTPPSRFELVELLALRTMRARRALPRRGGVIGFVPVISAAMRRVRTLRASEVVMYPAVRARCIQFVAVRCLSPRVSATARAGFSSEISAIRYAVAARSSPSSG